MKKQHPHRRARAHIDEPRFSMLVRAIEGNDPALSPEWAAEALGKARRGVRYLCKIVASRDPSQPRLAAVYGLASAELRSAEVNLLLRVFQDTSENPATRGQAAEALAGRIRFDSSQGPLRRRDVVGRFALLRGLGDPAPEVRFWSIFALAQRGNDWVVPQLETMRDDDAVIPRMWTVGQEAQWAINRISGGDPARDPSSF